jgi:hypothetical protein
MIGVGKPIDARPRYGAETNHRLDAPEPEELHEGL